MTTERVPWPQARLRAQWLSSPLDITSDRRTIPQRTHAGRKGGSLQTRRLRNRAIAPTLMSPRRGFLFPFAIGKQTGRPRRLDSFRPVRLPRIRDAVRVRPIVGIVGVAPETQQPNSVNTFPDSAPLPTALSRSWNQLSVPAGRLVVSCLAQTHSERNRKLHGDHRNG